MIHVEPIKRSIADSIIKENHYSGTVCFATQVSLGIFWNNMLVGIAQFGYGINPKGSCKWVSGSTTKDFLEFNRMWMADIAPHNSESEAIGKIFKWFKKNRPEIKWLISFADGANGKVGTIYQATNWIYTGHSRQGGVWVTSEGQRLTQVSMINKHKTTKRDTLELIYGTPLYRVRGGQFRYVYFLDKKWKKRLTVEPQLYPKLERLRDHLIIFKQHKVKEDLFDELMNLI
tara:strand:+ start:33 stop:725 length:693 start_codon:yes stop_codon:yes gene_type:complete